LVAVAGDPVDRHEQAAEAAGALVDDGAVEGKEPLGFVDLGVDAVLHLQEVSEPAAAVARSVAP
jgi:hypothetical protein